jgi:hypothetical protein
MVFYIGYDKTDFSLTSYIVCSINKTRKYINSLFLWVWAKLILFVDEKFEPLVENFVV